MSAADRMIREIIVKTAGEFDVKPTAILDHSQRDQDLLDARAVCAWRLNRDVGHSRMQAARAVGYQGANSALCQAFNRLVLRVYETKRLRRHVGVELAVMP